MSRIKYILTDIEGTTTSISFVYDVLFPYFRNNINKLSNMLDNEQIAHCLNETQRIVKEETGNDISIKESIEQLLSWSLQDVKIAPLKMAQGILWEEGYASGEIKGHLYPEVPTVLEKWKEAELVLGIYSSGSVKAQELLFGNSEYGNVDMLFSYHFDLKMGHKREQKSYVNIASEMRAKGEEILFLSDVVEELDAAKAAGYNCILLDRENKQPNCQYKVVHSFEEIILEEL